MPALDFDVYCNTCGDLLSTEVSGQVVTVDPCETRVYDARQDGYDDGHGEGYNVGYDDAQTTALKNDD